MLHRLQLASSHLALACRLPHVFFVGDLTTTRVCLRYLATCNSIQAKCFASRTWGEGGHGLLRSGLAYDKKASVGEFPASFMKSGEASSLD